MNSKVKKSDLSSTIILLCVLVILALAYFVINPVINKIKDLNIQISAKTTEVQALQNKFSALEQLKVKFSQSSEEVKKLGLAIPTANDMPEILTQLENMAQKNGLKVSTISPAKDSKKGVEALNIGLEGEYPSLVNFISQTEKNIRLIDIRSISLATAEKDGKTITSFTLGLEMLKAKDSNE